MRYPSGLFSDAFSWQTGMMNASWVSQFPSTFAATLLNDSVPWVNGKGGGSFVEGANRADFWGAKLIVCLNGYTDTPASAGQMAAFADSESALEHVGAELRDNRRSLQEWEQGRRMPDSATRAYLLVIASNPKAVEDAFLRRAS